jgi:8-oxo-dGTP pyrophosphatase MutT (NUDIX family)
MNNDIRYILNRFKDLNMLFESEGEISGAEHSLTIITYKGNYLLFKRSSNSDTFPNMYGLIGGGRERGETIIDNIKRECSEEINFTPEHLKYINDYEFNKDKIHLFQFEIPNLNLIKLNNEHVEFKLFTFDELSTNRDVIQTTIKFITDYVG